MEIRSGLTDLYSGDTDSLKNSLIGSIKGSTKKESNLLGYIGGTGVEVSGGYVTDLATAGLLNPATITATGGWSILGYGLANFTSGAATNIAAQKLRGEEEIGWGEVLSSGLIDTIPFFGQKLKGAKGITNVGVQAAARTVAQRQGEVALDDQRWLTPKETLEAAALGGAFGAGFKGVGEGISFLRGKYGKYGKNEAKKKFPTEVVEELDKQDRLVDDDAIDDTNRLRSGLKMRLRQSIDPESVDPIVPPRTQRDITPNITKANEKTLKKMGLWDYQSIFSMEELDGIITRSQAKGIVTPDIPGFTKAQAERLGRIDELKSFYKNLTIDQIIPELDHKNPLKLSAFLMDKSTGQKRVAIRKVILDEGVYLAEMAENMQALPREVHAIWTRNMNKYLGKTHKNFVDTFLAEMKVLGITDELDIAREYARRIKAARETFDVAFDAHKIIYGTEWTNNIDDMVNKLDEAFEAGDEWSPKRTNEAISRINESLSDLDEVPFNVETAQDLIRRFNLDDLDIHTLEDLFDKPMSEQVKFLKKHTGMTIGELNDTLSHWNMSIADLLDLLDR